MTEADKEIHDIRDLVIKYKTCLETIEDEIEYFGENNMVEIYDLAEACRLAIRAAERRLGDLLVAELEKGVKDG